jgi:hypothetical protein
MTAQIALAAAEKPSKPSLGLAALAKLSAPSLAPGFRPDLASPRQLTSDANARHGMYLTAAGTLTQFNAVMAAIHSAAFASIASGTLRTALGAALAFHALAAFVLCWAARPIASAKVSAFKLADDTFRNYRRGWRVTVVAMLLTAAALGVFLSENADGPMAEMLSKGKTAFSAWRAAQ